MSTSHIDPNAYSNLTNTSVNALENGTASLDVPTTRTSINETNEPNWTHSFIKFDRLLSHSTLLLVYRLIDIIILLIGLSSKKKTCTLSDRLVSTSIFLLFFYLIDLTIIVYYFFRNFSSNFQRLTDEEKEQSARRALALRTFFNFLKLIPICVGTSYALSKSTTDDCELIRFCLGIVCLSTLLTMFIPPTKPEIPPRRSFVLECLILLFLFIINGTYIGTVAAAIKNIKHPSCIYQNIEDIYLRAPLKSYAYVGLILFSCTTSIHILNLLVSQLCNRLRNGRRLYTYYYGFQYLLNYFGAVIVIYYFSIGALLLFKPRVGGECKTVEPDLYRTLLIWEWIRILTPLLVVPLVIILCCLGLFVGVILSYCLPASITVPLLDLIRVGKENLIFFF